MQVHERDYNPYFAAIRHRICPLALLTEWSAYVRKAQSWFESGQLGMTFVDAPPWISEAFAVLTSERSKADRFRRENGGKK